jgi:hypothetical protein
MSLVTYQSSNKSNASRDALTKNGAKADGVPTIASRMREMLAAAGRLYVRIFDVTAEARAQKRMIEAELYLDRYKHSSKNDDDLPIVR